MIRCIIVDDEPIAQEILERFIQIVPELTLVGKCNNALEAFDVLHSTSIDLMFLDIKMPSINGVDFVKALKNPPQIIFTTAFSAFAVNGFELDAVDYLLKPITFERFEKSVKKVLRSHVVEKTEEKTYTYFKVSGKLIKIYHKELVYAQSVKDYILLKVVNGSYLTHMTMKNLTALLPPANFIRVHRSYLINRTFVDRVHKTKLILGDIEIPIGEHYKANLDFTES